VNEHPANAAAMVRQRKKDSKNKRSAVLATIQAMERTHTPITVAEVARRAGVSPWLVRQEPLLSEVRNARNRLSNGADHGASDSNTGSHQVERELLRQENQRLRHETHRFRQRISELLGDQIDGTDAHSQSVLVQELTDQNADLSRQASEAAHQVHHLQQQLAALSTNLDASHAVNRSLMAELNRQNRAGT
jgi:FtsZ-binding cell division protein ZapB